MMIVRAHLYLTGQVQGVFFRSSARSQAKLKGVRGWVKNLPDGRVEAVLEGNKGDVDSVIDFCRKGPSGSRVDDVEISWERPSYKYPEFSIKT